MKLRNSDREERLVERLQAALRPSLWPDDAVRAILHFCAPMSLRGLVPAIRGALLLTPAPPAGAAALADACEQVAATQPGWRTLVARPYATRDPLAHFLATADPRLPVRARNLIAARLRTLRTRPHGDTNPELAGYGLRVAAKYLAGDANAVVRLEHADDAAACQVIAFPHLRESTAQGYRAALREALGVRPRGHTSRDRARAAVNCSGPAQPQVPRSLLAVLMAPGAGGARDQARDHSDQPSLAEPRALTAAAALKIPRGLRPGPVHGVAILTRAVRATDVPAAVQDVLVGALLAMRIAGWPPVVLEAFASGRATVDPVEDTVMLDATLYPPDVGLQGTAVQVRIGARLAAWLRHETARGGLALALPGQPRRLRARDLVRTVDVVNTRSRHPVWLRDLQGGIWYRGRPSWTANQLALATTQWDRAFRRPFGYCAFIPVVDVSRLHDAMYEEVRRTWTSPDAPRGADQAAA